MVNRDVQCSDVVFCIWDEDVETAEETFCKTIARIKHCQSTSSNRYTESKEPSGCAPR